jgi:2-hydroxychromene-2-carboxylate isomerase
MTAAGPGAPVFFYDFYSPYAYLAAQRVDDVLPVAPEWRPIVFGAMLREQGRIPWSLQDDTRQAGVEECERRAAERGLPPMRWPDGWPAESYSVLPLRAALVAREEDRLREFSFAAYERVFVEGRTLEDLETVLEAADQAGLDRDAVAGGVDRPDLRDRLRQETQDALALGVPGVPTVAVGSEMFWGDDRLEEAAARLSR